MEWLLTYTTDQASTLSIFSFRNSAILRPPSSALYTTLGCTVSINALHWTTYSLTDWLARSFTYCNPSLHCGTKERSNGCKASLVVQNVQGGLISDLWFVGSFETSPYAFSSALWTLPSAACTQAPLKMLDWEDFLNDTSDPHIR